MRDSYCVERVCVRQLVHNYILLDLPTVRLRGSRTRVPVVTGVPQHSPLSQLRTNASKGGHIIGSLNLTKILRGHFHCSVDVSPVPLVPPMNTGKPRPVNVVHQCLYPAAGFVRSVAHPAIEHGFRFMIAIL